MRAAVITCAVALAAVGRAPDIVLASAAMLLGLVWIASVLRSGSQWPFAGVASAVGLASLPLSQDPLLAIPPLVVGIAVAGGILATLSAEPLQGHRAPLVTWTPVAFVGLLFASILVLPRWIMPHRIAVMWDLTTPPIIFLVVVVLVLMAWAVRLMLPEEGDA